MGGAGKPGGSCWKVTVSLGDDTDLWLPIAGAVRRGLVTARACVVAAVIDHSLRPDRAGVVSSEHRRALQVSLYVLAIANCSRRQRPAKPDHCIMAKARGLKRPRVK